MSQSRSTDPVPSAGISSGTESLAQSTLLANWRGGFAVPSARLYPFQWNWDAGFDALGFSYFDVDKAFQELRSMFKGQWKNGMLPHIVFHQPSPDYFPGPGEWQTQLSGKTPDGVETSGITQPAVFGFILERMRAHLERAGVDCQELVEELYPKIIAYHRYLYTQRDPDKEGLVYVHHNWESMDNSPLWDSIFDKMDVWRARDVSALRKDNRRVSAAERPSDENYKRYIHIVDLLKSVGYDEARSFGLLPLVVQDVLFNAILIRSNESLIQIGRSLGKDTSEIEGWNDKARASFQQKLWDERSGFYYSYDMKARAPIPIKVSAGLLPLFAGICTPDQARRLEHHLLHSFVKGPEWLLCPSTAADEPTFDPVRYWRGPVWVNVNWMLYHGLRRYGLEASAGRVRAQTLGAIERHGMYEYFDSRPAEEGGAAHGLGADCFSWTAAMYLDFVRNTERL